MNRVKHKSNERKRVDGGSSASLGELIRVVDETDFRKWPYRGVLKRVSQQMGLRQDSMSRMVHRTRNPEALMAVAAEVKRINRLMGNAAKGARA